MTWLAEVSIAPAEPLGYAAAEFAFEFDIVQAMFFAVFNSTLDSVRGALSAHELLFLEFFLILFLVEETIFEPTKIRALALEAFVVGQLIETEFLELAVVLVPWLQVLGVLFKSFVLSSLNRLLL